MRQLLDTHTFIWFVTGNSRINENVRLQVENNDNLISIASLWEIAIKSSIGRLDLELSIEQLVEEQIAANGIEILNINTQHIAVVANLPLHHRDPFDRCDAYASDRALHGTGRECARIAQAMVEQLPIVV
ncbi:MAG: type II toxin-antitoxin system VapC family toxin [Cyanobacteria bacterium P01_G01_bin.19]